MLEFGVSLMTGFAKIFRFELNNKVFEGTRAVRRLASGHSFQLAQHDRYADAANSFKVLWVEHEARNNFDASIKGGPAFGVEAGTYRNSFSCVREAVATIQTTRPVNQSFKSWLDA